MSARGHMVNTADNASMGSDGMTLAKDDVVAARDDLVASTQSIPLVADDDVPRAGAFDGGIIAITTILVDGRRRRALGRS